MLSTFRKTLRDVVSYTTKIKFHNSRVTRRQELPPLNHNDEMKIIEKVNKSTVEELVEYDVKPSQLKKIMAFRERNGKFRTFNDMLISLDIALIVKLCKSILVGDKKAHKRKTSRPRKLVITPALDESTRKDIKKVLGVKVCGDRISWALIDEHKKLCTWDSRTCGNSYKSPIITVINEIIHIISELPRADAYVMEEDPHISLSKLTTAGFAFHLQRRQMIAIIISVLRMKDRTIYDGVGRRNNFYILPPHESARKYDLRVGTETVSAETVVEKLFTDAQDPDNKSSVVIEHEDRSRYLSENCEIREQLNAVLLVTLTFFDSVRNKEPV